MSDPFRVAMDDEGCGACEHGRTFHVIGPNEMANSVSYGNVEDAEYLRDECNRAFELGRRATQWTAFSESTMPPDLSEVIVWDAQFSRATSFIYFQTEHTLESLSQSQYTHYVLLAKAFSAPSDLAATPPAIQAAPVPPLSDVPTLSDAAPPDPAAQAEDQWGDDTPF